MSADDIDTQPDRATLTDDDIVSRKIGRRRLLRGLSLLGASALIGRPASLRAQVFIPQTECYGVECDPNYNSQGTYGPPAGHGGNQGLPGRDTYGGGSQAGRCLSRTGFSDSDWGQFADAQGCGRFGPTQTGYTDCDNGPSADPGGYGNGQTRMTGLTDSDGGAFADYAQCGRRGY